MSDMSAGQIVGGVIGAVVGGYFLGPQGAVQGFALGAGIGGYIDPPPGPNLKGPTLDDKTFQSSAYGVSIPRLYGTIATMGNIIYLENNEYKAVSKKERQGGKGGGGGATYENTTYFATFAVSLSEALPESAALRVWGGGKLIYQIRADGVEYAKAQYKYYDGTQTEPDSRMESVLGVGNCPSYEGTAYIIFYDLELTDFGNGLAGCPIKVEIGSAEFADDFELVDHFSLEFPDDWLPGPSTLRPMNGPSIFTANVAKNTEFQEAVFSAKFLLGSPNQLRYAIRPSGIATSDNITGVSDRHVSAVTYDYSDPDTALAHVGVMIDGEQHRNGYSRFPLVNSGAYMTPYRIYDGSGSLLFLGAASPILPLDNPWPIDPNGWYLSKFNVGSPVIDFNYYGSDPGCIIVGTSFCVRIAAGSPTIVYIYNYEGIELKSFEVILPYSFSGGRGFMRPGMFYTENKVIFLLSGISETAIGQFDFIVIDIAEETLQHFQVFGPGTSTTSGFDYPSISIFNNLICIGQNIGSHEYGFWLFDSLPISSDAGLAYLQDIVDQWLRLSGLDHSQFDTSALAGKIVKGYRVSEPSSARGAIEQLKAIYMFDLIEDGYSVNAVLRGTSAETSIPKDNFVPMDNGRIYQRSIDSRVLMPSKYTVNYIDPVREYDANSQYADYPTAYSSEVSVNFAVVMSAEDAAKQADILIKTTWNENSTFEFQLPQSYLHLKAGSVVDAEFQPGIFTQARIENISKSENQVLSLTARSTQAYTYQSDAVGTESSTPPSSTPIFLVDTGAILMDLPLISDSVDYAGFLVGAIGSNQSWPGAVLHRSVDSGQTYSAVDRFSGSTTCGTAGSSLSASEGFVIDDASLTVWPAIGVFESVTYEQMMSGKNYIAYGADGRWEICQYQDATPMLDGSIVLSTFVRCLGGTEWASGLHQDGDDVVYIADIENRFIGMNEGVIGVDYLYKMPTVGQSVTDVDAQSFAYRAVNLTPLSPANLSTSRASNDWIFNFQERTRYSESFWYTGIIPRREFPGGFEMDIYKLGVVVRTLVSSTNQFTYTAAQQTVDFGGVQIAITAKIYQLNQHVGRGYALEVNI